VEWRPDCHLGPSAVPLYQPWRTAAYSARSEPQQDLAIAPHLPLVMIGMLATSCAPTLAALFIVGLYPGAGGVRSIARQLGIWRVGLVWYGLALVGPIILLLTAEAFNAVRRGGPPPHWIVPPSFSGPSGLYFVIFGSLFAEEPGWRGLHNPGCRPVTAPYQPVLLSEFFGAPGICGT